MRAEGFLTGDPDINFCLPSGREGENKCLIQEGWEKRNWRQEIMTITWRNLAVKERREKEQQLAGEEYGIEGLF